MVAARPEDDSPMPNLFSQIPVAPGTDVRLPRMFDRLYDLAYNMWWTWDHEASQLWSRIARARWAEGRNPLTMLQTVDLDQWQALEADDTFVSHYEDIVGRFDAYLEDTDTWYRRHHEGRLDPAVAYLSAEFGVHHTLPFYSGGLGVLAGDHAKAASDLGLPFVGIGIFYRRGYFRQEVDHDGEQQHHYHHIETTQHPVRRVVDNHGRPLSIEIEFPDRVVVVAAWRIDVGRVPLVLLDTDVPQNDPADRPITHILYVLGREMRFSQELVLGIGGVRLMEQLGIEPSAWHINEGHASLSLIDRLSTALAGGLSLEAAHEAVSRKTLFTLHTPVPAGNEVFDAETVKRYVGAAVPDIDPNVVLEVGRSDGDGGFNMGATAIRLSRITNGVSKRHAEVASKDWEQLIGGPALAITNGIHTPSWVGHELAPLFAHSLGEKWADLLLEPEAWKVIFEIPDADLWKAHRQQKGRLMRRLRRRLQDQFARHGAGPDELRMVDFLLPEERLTLVFARRFATYKRAGLIFSDLERITSILTNPSQPMQIIFAGKAHPADREGQALIRWVTELARSDELGGHVQFIEDYNIEVARLLVSGGDAWLNTPRAPMEASGTSGMKAAANGVLNLSVLDGWWPEGYDASNGWSVAASADGDTTDATVLYRILEEDLVPRFYDRGPDGLPHRWLEMMKASIASLAPAFSAHRMTAEYATKAYLPLAADD
jgi:starch phosphorylase